VPLELRKLRPFHIPHDILDQVEEELRENFKRSIYVPLLRILRGEGVPGSELQNAGGPDALGELRRALDTGRLTFNRGTFSGKFNAKTSKSLKDLGARWDRKTSTFKIQLSELPPDLQTSIRASESKFQEKLNKINKGLSQILPEEVAAGANVSKMLDAAIFKVDKSFEENVKGISLAPSLTQEQRTKIAKEWTDNLKLDIKGWATDEIKSLRRKVEGTVFAGDRYGSLVKTVQESYEVSANKAKFLARQETKLLTVKYQETRYTQAGINEYFWNNVTGTPAHPVRPRHKALGDASKKGKTFRWDSPPVTTEIGEPERRNNPGQDYNCRCWAIPVVRMSS
jgi:SPP1 gp7 family putative phage head morphogenesis protein